MTVKINMDMPKSCKECIFTSLGNCLFDSKIDTYFQREGYIRRDRPFDCPLKECK